MQKRRPCNSMCKPRCAAQGKSLMGAKPVFPDSAMSSNVNSKKTRDDVMLRRMNFKQGTSKRCACGQTWEGGKVVVERAALERAHVTEKGEVDGRSPRAQD